MYWRLSRPVIDIAISILDWGDEPVKALKQKIILALFTEVKGRFLTCMTLVQYDFIEFMWTLKKKPVIFEQYVQAA